ncbi:TRAP transporter small permease [Aeromicrobium sp. YIM 150415]|uniref:TRAP transporter small permease n=1 Tax=Aeromicrobium sp. YIM 150415 TaxID=2803912 RepID=UPI0019665AAC|nr:TRAP transporter small permease [Aeromicrobium sp. YIM 150415]
MDRSTSALITAVRAVDRWVRPIERALAMMAGLGVGILAFLLLVDMIRRRFFNETFAWLYNFTGLYVFAAAIFLSLAYAHRLNAHIALDVITTHLSRRWNRVFGFVGELVGIVLFTILAYAGLRATSEAFSAGYTGERTLPWPLWTHYVLLPIGASLAVIRSMLKLLAGDALDDPESDDPDAAASVGVN